MRFSVNRYQDDKMKKNTDLKYFISCFLLVIPILAWNVFLTDKLPAAYHEEVFWKDIPPFLRYGENSMRLVVFAFTLLMPLSISTKKQKGGLILYLTGITIYFFSWVLLIHFPASEWSNSLAGFAAPAYTPLLWLAGIGLIGKSSLFNLPLKHWHFSLAATIFLVFHNAHTVMIYYRIH